MNEFSLDKIAVEVIDRKRMKAAKSWRIFLALPESPKTLPAVLSAMIEQQVRCCLTTYDGDNNPLSITVDPIHIDDVVTVGKGKNKKFHLVLETCYEFQAQEIAHKLTSMVGENGELSLSKSNPAPAPAAAHSSSQQHSPHVPQQEKPILPPDLLKGLHVAFFQNTYFFQYVSMLLPGSPKVSSPEECKQGFKKLAGVESCKDLTETYVRDFIRQFNEWLQNNRRNS